MADAWDPLTGSIPPEVPLPQAPLTRVIAQVRFPTIAAVESPALLAPFQEAVRPAYPFLRQERGPSFIIGVAGVQTEPSSHWRFTQTSGVGVPDGWSMVLTKDFLALETKRYTSRQDFLSRLEVAIRAFIDAFKPPVMDRLGIRYIDRIQGDDIANITKLVRPEVLGVLALPVGVHVKPHHHALTDVQFSIEGGGIRARWARLAPGTTIDPSSIEPVPDPSWILDLDAFTEQQMAFDAHSIIQRARHFSERIYSFFRWSVTDDFLRRFGGNI